MPHLLKDIQSQRDYRRININKVGVKNISYPITLLDKAKRLQHTVATVNMYVNLPHRFKGTHMSRFIEILNRFHGDINLENFQNILEEMKLRLQAEAAHIELEFPYFLEKENTPNAIGISRYRCMMHGALHKEYDLTLKLEVPISPPLPYQTNKGLPRSMGHWGIAEICVRFRHFIWIEQLIQMVEEITSRSRHWPAATDLHPDHSLTVEEITKALGKKIMNCEAIRWFTITVENLSEGFSTFASIEWPETEQSHTT